MEKEYNNNPNINSNKIPDGWKLKKFEEITNTLTDFVANGSFASLRENVKYNYDEDYAILIRLQDFRNNFKGPFVYVNKKSYDFLKKSVILPSDIIISNVGAYAGMIFRAPNFKGPMTLGPNAVLFRSSIDDNFIYFWLKSDKGQESLKSIITTTAQPKFNKTDLKKILCLIPPINEQRKIASILSTIDDFIENTDHLINSYTLLKKGLMQTLLTKGIGHKEFKKTELGIIPINCQIKKLVEVRDLTKKNSFIDGDWIESEFIANEGIRLIQTGNIGIGDFIENENKKYISEKTFIDLNCKEVEVGDLLICRMAEPTGRSCIVPNLGNKMITSVDCVIVKVDNKNFDLKFINYFLNTDLNLKNILKYEQGSTRKRISRKNLENIKIPIPPLDEQKQISNILERFDIIISIYQLKNKYLNNLKKGLMQQLLTGKIRVKV